MLQHWYNSAGMAIAFLLALSLAGCADSGGLEIPYPKLAAVERIKLKLLSKEEQKATIEDLAFEQENHRGKAIETIEKR